MIKHAWKYASVFTSGSFSDPPFLGQAHGRTLKVQYQCVLGSHFIVWTHIFTMILHTLMVPLGWRISAWVCAGGIQLANIRVTWSLSLRVRCQYYCIGGQPIISAQHFNVEFLQCTDGSWCPLECWWQFNTYRVSTLKGGTLTEILGSSPGQETWLMSFAMEKPQSTWGSQMWC